jgi:hypothetical protein
VDIYQKPLHQEQAETSRTKAVMKHELTPKFFLNVYSIHNYKHILLIVPDTLCKTPIRVVNVAEAHAVALHQLRDKRAAKQANGDVSQPADDGEGGDAQVLSAPPPLAFDHAPTKMQKPAPKAKAKAKGPSARGKSSQRLKMP